MTQNNKNSKKIDKFIPYFFIIFFAIIFIADFSFVYIAKKTWRGVYTDQSYEKGKNYNKSLEAVKKQKELGWNLSLKYQENGKNSAILISCLKDKNNNLIKDAKLKAKISRPTQEGFDFVQDFIQENGCYQAKINFPLQGQWDVEIQAFQGKNVMQMIKRYVVR